MSSIEGLDEIVKKLDSLADPDKYVAAMGKACAAVEATAKEKAPKDTGALRRSIASKIDVEGGDLVGVIYTPLEYAPYVEYGTGLFAENGGRKDGWSYKDDKGEWHHTKGQKPQPFLRPALYENQDKIVEILKEGIKND